MTNQAKVGIFSAITIIIFIIGFYYLKGIDLFEGKNVYYAVYDRVDGLYQSTPVEVNGLPIGRVGKMARDPKTGKIVVELDLDNDVKIPKSDSTVAILISTDLLGAKKVKLIFGNSEETMQDGDTISTDFRKDLSEQIDPLVYDIKKIVPQVDSTIRGIRWLFDEGNPKGIYYTLGGLNQAVGHVNTILEGNEQNLRLTLKNLESISRNIEKNNAAITGILKNAHSITDSLQQANLKGLVNNLNGAVGELDSVLSSVNNGDGTLGKLVKDDALYVKLDTTVGNLNALLKDVKDRPYRYINVSVFGSKKRDARLEKKLDESKKQ